MNTNANRIYNNLKKMFPNPACELVFFNNYQLLVSVILSAQCTDKRVNLVTESLFKKYPNIQKMARANLEELEKDIKPCGLYHNKAKNIIEACKKVISDYNGNIPEEYNSLLSLPGVGRKTANVITSVGFGGSAIAVDTHVFRVSKRIGIACGKTPKLVEFELMNFFDKKLWSEIHFLLVLLGRYICKARKPLCELCLLKDKCLHYKKLCK